MTSWVPHSDAVATSQMPPRHLAVGQSKKGAGQRQGLVSQAPTMCQALYRDFSQPILLPDLVPGDQIIQAPFQVARASFMNVIAATERLFNEIFWTTQLFGFNEKLMPLYSKLCQKLGKHHATLKNEGVLRFKKKSPNDLRTSLVASWPCSFLGNLAPQANRERP